MGHFIPNCLEKNSEKLFQYTWDTNDSEGYSDRIIFHSIAQAIHIGIFQGNCLINSLLMILDLTSNFAKH